MEVWLPYIVSAKSVSYLWSSVMIWGSLVAIAASVCSTASSDDTDQVISVLGLFAAYQVFRPKDLIVFDASL